MGWRDGVGREGAESCLKLGLLRLEDTVELSGEHDVTLDLQLARHECLLAVELSVGHVHEG